MAAGLPIVASSIEGYSELLTDGNEGILVPPRDEQALAEAVCSLLQDRVAAIAMGARGQDTAAHYSWERVAEQIVDLYVKTGMRSPSAYSAFSLAAWSALS
jgi:phosphatidylinositol alpha-mannosyltransferase